MRPANIKEAVKSYLRSEKVRKESRDEHDNVATIQEDDFCDDNLYQWGLDRVDQSSNTLDCDFYDAESGTKDGNNVRIYIMDTGDSN